MAGRRVELWYKVYSTVDAFSNTGETARSAREHVLT